MYTQLEVTNMLFFDTETVSKYSSIEELKSKEPELYESWTKKIVKYHDGYGVASENEMYIRYAGLYPEFSKIVCISMGKISFPNAPLDLTPELKIASVVSDDEKEILEKSWKYFNKSIMLAGFNIIDFDVPLMCRKLLYHGIALPIALQIRGKKPWEINMSDTMKDLMFGSTKKISLERVSMSMGIGTSKDGDVKGENLSEFYWTSGDDTHKLLSIKTYCEADVRINMEIVAKMLNENLYEPK